MIALIGTAIGFLGSLFPELIKLFREKADRIHELAIMDRQMEMTKLGHVQKMEELSVNADISESLAVYKSAEITLTGVRWIDGLVSLLTSSVRPVLTYAFFTLYTLVKWGQYQNLSAMRGDLGFGEILNRLWTPEDMGIFCTIISFWFGSRAMSKFFTKKGG